MRTNEKVIKEISVGNENIPISAKYIGDYEIDDIKDMIDQEVISGISDFSFYDDGTNATTVNLQLKSGQDKRDGLYFDTVNLATGKTGETFAAGGGLSITAATSSKAGVMSASDKSKLDGINKGYTIPYIVGSSSDSTGVWTGSCDGITSYKDGLTIIYVPQIAGISSGTTLNINGLGAKACYINNSKMTTHFAINTPVLLTYITQSGVGYWKCADYIDGNTYTSAYCTTGGGIAAKTASLSNYVLTSKTYTFISISNANTVQGPITLNINSKGAKPIYINGSASSASNYTLPAGTYIIYYDGTNYHFRTDGKLPNTTYGVATTSANGLMSKGMYSALKDGFITNITNVTSNGNYVELTYAFASPNSDGTFEIMEGEGVEIPLATTTTAGVMSANDKAKLDGTNVGYGTCTTPASTAAKTVSLNSGVYWKAKPGSVVYVWCSYSNSANSPTLNVNQTGAYPIYYNGSQITTSNKTYATYANRLMKFLFTGAYYLFVGWGVDTNTTYSVATATTNGLMSAADKAKLDGLSTGGSGGDGGYSEFIDAVSNADGSLFIPSEQFFSNATWVDSPDYEECMIDFYADGEDNGLFWDGSKWVYGNNLGSILIPYASDSRAGVMSAADKIKLNGMGNPLKYISYDSKYMYREVGDANIVIIKDGSWTNEAPDNSSPDYYHDNEVIIPEPSANYEGRIITVYNRASEDRTKRVFLTTTNQRSDWAFNWENYFYVLVGKYKTVLICERARNESGQYSWIVLESN